MLIYVEVLQAVVHDSCSDNHLVHPFNTLSIYSMHVLGLKIQCELKKSTKAILHEIPIPTNSKDCGRIEGHF